MSTSSTPSSSKGKVALVTGATRGIGKASALALARAGFAVVVTGRTLHEGAGRADDPLNPVALPGSIEQTVQEVRAIGAEALGVPLDILDRDAIDAAINRIMSELGRIDVLLNNAIYAGPENRQPLLDIDSSGATKVFDGNLLNQLYLTQRVLPIMLSQGGGRILFMSSMASVSMPLAKPPAGGSGLLYAASKAAFNRVADFVHLEHFDAGIRSFLIHPAFTYTDTMQAKYGATSALAANYENFPAEATADVVAWLASSPKADSYSGKGLISAPHFFKREGIDPLAT